MLGSSLNDISWTGYGFAFGFVLVGATLQVATGVGLGLIAGPSLLFFLDGPAAILTAIIISLILTACLLPSELRDVSKSTLLGLSRWAAVGVPVGTSMLVVANATALKVASGILVLLAVAQLRYVSGRAQPSTRSTTLPMRLGGALSGVMTGALAVPGPVALWAMLSAGLDPTKIRATMRAYFMAAYLLALVVHLIIAPRTDSSWFLSATLVPALALGIVLGLLARKALSANQLRTILEVVLLLMGMSLLCRGIWDAIQSTG